MKIGLICGYRRTGKDVLFNILSGMEAPERFQWRIYKQNEHKDLVKRNNYIRSGFADKLKQEASEQYNIPLIIPDAEKDIKQFKHYKTGQLVSARDIYIEWGSYRRSQNINYWCQAAFDNITKDSDDICIVTDWRFKNEVQYVLDAFNNVTTVRLYRSDVQVPDINIASEHELDNYQTDLLLIRDNVEDEFQKAVTLFPQYKDYIPYGKI